MMTFSPILPWPVTGVCLVLAGTVSFMGYWRLKKIIRRGYLAGLVGLRVLILTALALLLSRPSWKRLIPDPAALKTVVLADCSGSMRVRDSRSREGRFQTVHDVIREVAGNPSVFGQHDERLGFNETVFPLLLPVEPSGRSGIGTALTHVADMDGWETCGSVILVSDGNWTIGESPAKAAMELGRRGLPVSCVLAGAGDAPEDLSVTSAGGTTRVGKGERCSFTFTVKSSFRRNREFDVVFSVSGRDLERRKVTLAAGEAARDIHFEDTVWQLGNHIYSARIDSPEADSVPENDVTFQGVEVTPPEMFAVAYLSGSLGWDFKMIKHVLEASKQFEISAMIQTGAKRFYRYGDLFKAEETEFPASLNELSRFDLVILRYDALPLMGEDIKTLLEDFVDKRGGGLLVIGDGTVPEALADLMPVRDVRLDVPPGAARLTVADERVFPSGAAVSLHTAPGARVPGGFPVAAAESVKFPSRPVLSLNDTRHVLAVQHFGGGRVGWLGFEGSWRWPLEGGDDVNRHVVFWEQLLVWLASGSKPRVHIPLHGKTVRTGDDFLLTAHLLDSDYNPLTQAKASGTLTQADGTVEEIMLSPSPDHPGRFEAPFRLSQAGGCAFTVRAEPEQGEKIAGEAFFIASHGGEEMTNPVSREDVLRDVARLSGGRFFTRNDMASFRKGVPISRRVPEMTVTRHPTESVFYGIILLTCLCGEWYFRRRIGLK
ncbi:MAG: VWA domain-containing protein [Lentisphaeria bacterium]|nr:VWA domain-containing protein [Lentisphaeria bacterium]